MLRFVSEEYYLRHLEYLNNLKLKYSVMKKSISGLDNCSAHDLIRRIKGSKEYLRVARLLAEIELHDTYFISFGEREYAKSKNACSFFGSESALLTKLYFLAMELNYGFVGVCRIKAKLDIFCEMDCIDVFRRGVPVLALDVCEHAYFGDYQYNKEHYIKEALKCLRVGELDNF